MLPHDSLDHTDQEKIHLLWCWLEDNSSQWEIQPDSILLQKENKEGGLFCRSVGLRIQTEDTYGKLLQLEKKN